MVRICIYIYTFLYVFIFISGIQRLVKQDPPKSSEADRLFPLKASTFFFVVATSGKLTKPLKALGFVASRVFFGPPIATSSGNWTYLTYRSSETRWLPRKIPIMNGCCCCLTDLMTMDIRVSQLLIHRDRIKSTSMNTSGVHSIQFKNQPTSWDVNKVRFFLKWRFKLPIWYLGSDNANANFDWLTLTCGLFGLVYNIITPVLR